jgi:hypothetical protein
MNHFTAYSIFKRAQRPNTVFAQSYNPSSFKNVQFDDDLLATVIFFNVFSLPFS